MNMLCKQFDLQLQVILRGWFSQKKYVKSQLDVDIE